MTKTEDKIRLLLLDIDGTILNDDWAMLPETAEALAQLHEAGLVMGIASGRNAQDIDFLVKKWGLPFRFDWYIGLNGCELTDNRTGVQTLTHLLPEEIMAHVVTEMEREFSFIPFVYEDGVILATEISPVIASSARKSGREPVLVSKEVLWEKPRPKIMLRTETADEVTKMEVWLQSHPFEGTAGFKTQATLLEFAHPDISKAVPFDRICAAMGITKEQVMAAGDTTNDNAMLKEAGIGIALKNATADTLACADEVTEWTNNEDGLMRHLKKHHSALFTKEYNQA